MPTILQKSIQLSAVSFQQEQKEIKTTSKAFSDPRSAFSKEN